MLKMIANLLIGVAVVLSAVGCRTAAYHDYAAFVREPRPNVVGQAYTVGVPDVLAVAVTSERGVSETFHTLGPDGQLRLAQLGQVQAVGFTTTQIAAQLEAIARDHAEITGVAVRVEAFTSQKVFVFGQVDESGAQPYHGANSVLEAVARAQPNVRADVKHIQVLRPSPDGEFRRRLTVDLDVMVRGGDTTLDVILAEGDVIFVPPTALGSVGLAWEQLFAPSPRRESAAPVVAAAANLATDSAPLAAPTVGDPASQTQRRLDAATQLELEALRLSLASLTDEIRAMREASADDTALRRAVFDHAQARAEAEAQKQADAQRQASSAAVFTSNDTPAEGVVSSEPEFYDVSSPRNSAAMGQTADVQRGGVGESAPPEGVRFWGP